MITHHGMPDTVFKLTTSASNTDGLIGIPVDDQVYYTFVLPPHGTRHEAGGPDTLEMPKKKWRCIHCGRPNWVTSLTCEGCGAPEGER